MRVNKISDREIRFEITDTDLTVRSLSLNDLKYGNRETMKLFKEIVQTASVEYGFNREELPVMIEAVPMENSGLLLIVSAVDEPEEMDPHFARYATDETVQPQVQQDPAQPQHDAFYEENSGSPALNACLISFTSIDDVIQFCNSVHTKKPCKNDLYLDEKDHTFYLALKRQNEEKEFVALINSITEFGHIVQESAEKYAFLKEHSTPCMENPLEKLASVHLDKKR